eukprot:CAMPEP_0168538382 /NCGR_PEP_ID=MMETSP0405-20121227/21054_1 /TAXON_ID=498012 /ORGANISM="Trichosphaerium sp, Strain Am-I-7 wt" /LENGTH=34 /DNA_ID= /DNA_START= /DNA_END= /DNA_ORIENTATION=
MLHELCHNRHSDHNEEFWTLYRKLTKEVISLDWT